MDRSDLWKSLEGTPAEWGWFLGGLAGVLVLIWMIFKIVGVTREHEDPAEVREAMLSQIGELQRQGDLSDEEYRSIKNQLTEPEEGSKSESNSDG